MFLELCCGSGSKVTAPGGGLPQCVVGGGLGASLPSERELGERAAKVSSSCTKKTGLHQPPNSHSLLVELLRLVDIFVFKL